MKHMTLGALLAAAMFAPSLQPSLFAAQASQKAIVLSWDGTVPNAVDEFLRAGKLPNLAKLIAGGAFANDVIPVFPSKTAPGHASLWTGAPPRSTGISGNRIPRTPRSHSTIQENVSGFDGSPLRAETLWMAAHRSGLRTVLLPGPFGGERPASTIQFRGYESVVGRDGVISARQAKPGPAAGWTHLPRSEAPPLEMVFAIGTSTFFGLMIDDPTDLQSGYDTLLVTESRDGRELKAKLKPGLAGPDRLNRWSGPVAIKASDQSDAGVYLRLFDLKHDGRDFLLYFTRPARMMSPPAGPISDWARANWPFVGNGASSVYSQGGFGATIPDGGDGTAERRYLDVATFVQRRFMDGAGWAIKNLPWDLYFAYTPYPDEAEHLWRGYLDPGLPGFRPEIAERLLLYLLEAYQMCDEFLGLLMGARPDQAIFVLVSDHGMEGIENVFAINSALQRSGLLALDNHGRLDLARTKVFYPPMNNGYLLINTTERKEGIVEPAERSEIVARVRQALSEISHGERRLVTNLFDAASHGEAMGIGGEAGGDLYLELLPGFDFDARLGVQELIAERKPYGMHGFDPQRKSMRTVMVFNGPGVAAGRRLKEVRVIDLAPTLSRLLDISTPRDATGQVLTEVLSE